MTAITRAVKVYPTKEELLEIFRYDPEDGSLHWLHPGPGRSRSKPVGHKTKPRAAHANRRKSHYLVASISKKQYPCHRLVWIMHFGSIPEGLQIDHIDGNGLNNKIANLRLVTPLEQGRNKARSVKNTSGLTGVRRNESDTRWWDGYVGKTKIGTFGSKREAHERILSIRSQQGYHPNHGRD